jgi:hypothetical protein
MNSALRTVVYHGIRRFGVPVLKCWRHPCTARVIRSCRKTLFPQLAAERVPPDQVLSLPEYVAAHPDFRLPLKPDANPHQETAARLPGARVFGAGGQVCHEPVLLSDVSFEWFMEPAQLSGLFRLRLPPVTRLDGIGASIAVVSGHCYYHWLFNSLPRLGILEAAGVRLGGLDFIITNPIRHAFQRDSLAQLGVRPEQIRETSGSVTYRPDALLLTTIPNWVRNFHHEFLRTRVAPAPPPEHPGRRLYLARQGSRHRQVANEPEVIAALAKVGIESCQPETLSFGEQIRLFQSARLVVAPHGAALANIVFCPPGATVVEVFSRHYFNDCYQNLAREAGLAHHALTEQSGIELVSDHRYVEEPMTIHVPHLMRQLATLGVA